MFSRVNVANEALKKEKEDPKEHEESLKKECKIFIDEGIKGFFYSFNNNSNKNGGDVL